MKKMFLVVVCLFATAHLTQAQVSFGLNASVVYDFLHTADTVDSKSGRMGFGYGLSLDFKKRDDQRAYFATGAYVTSNGGSYTVLSGKDTTVETSVRAQTLQVPLSLKLKTGKVIPKLDKLNFVAQIGVVPGVTVRSRYDREINNVKTVDSEPAKDLTNLLDISLKAGIGLDYELSGGTTAYGGFVYHHGFLPLVNDKAHDVKLKPSNIGLRVGVYF